MTVVVSLASCRNAKTLVNGHESQEANDDPDAQQKILVVIDLDKLDAIGLILSKKDLRQKMEKSVAKQPSHGKCNHDR